MQFRLHDESLSSENNEVACEFIHDDNNTSTYQLAQDGLDSTLRQVLQLVGFQPTRCGSDQSYGGCLLPGCSLGANACLSVQVTLERCYCHHCHRHGHQLQHWAVVTGLPLYPAALDLCAKLGHDVPWL